MSRSYRKNWIFTDNYGSPYKKWAKRQANKRVRKTKEIQDGQWYRKVYDSWNICDYKIHHGGGYNRRRADATWVKGYSNYFCPFLIPFWRIRNK